MPCLQALCLAADRAGSVRGHRGGRQGVHRKPLVRFGADGRIQAEPDSRRKSMCQRLLPTFGEISR